MSKCFKIGRLVAIILVMCLPVVGQEERGSRQGGGSIGGEGYREASDYVVKRLGLRRNSVVVDIGAGDGWITSEFFRQYGDYGYDILGDNYLQTQTEYISQFREFTLPECWWFPDTGWDIIDEKTVQQWVLLGDPSLKMGGYE